MYQRSKIQDEPTCYEHRKHDGSLPIIGVNTFLGGKESHATGGEQELMPISHALYAVGGEYRRNM